MPLIEQTNNNQSRLLNTGGDYYRAAPILKDRLVIATATHESTRLFNVGFRYNIGINELEVYVNGHLKRAKETISGVSYGDFDENTNYSVLFESGVVVEGDQVRFRVTSNSYDYSTRNLNNILQVVKDLYGIPTEVTGIIGNDGSPILSNVVYALAYRGSTTSRSGSGYYHDGTIQAAIDAIDSTTTLVLTSGSWEIENPLVIPENICLKVNMGATLNISGSGSLSINGPIEAGLWRIFSGTEPDLTSAIIRYAPAEWFGYSDPIVFTSNIANPSVKYGSIFLTNNTIATSFTNFVEGYLGQNILVIIGDNSTTIDFSSSNLKGNSGADWSPASGDHMICRFDGSNWYCNISDNTI